MNLSPARLVITGLAIEACCVAFAAVTTGPSAVQLLIILGGVIGLLHASVVIPLHGRTVEFPEKVAVGIILGFAVLFRATLVPHAPIASDDLWRYLWDGKVMLHGVNPYAYAPADPALAWLASADLPARVNHPQLGSVYPPAAEAFFALSALLVRESVTGFKILLSLVDIGTLVLFLPALRKLRRPLTDVVVYAWSPLPLLYGSLDGHIDILGIPFLVLVVLWGTDGRWVRAGLATAGAALVKLHPLALAPLLARRKPLALGIPLLMGILGVVVAAYLPFSGHLHQVIHWLRVFSSRWEFNAPLFSLVYASVGENEQAHLILSGILALWVAWVTWRKGHFLDDLFLILLGLVVFGSVVHPWYLLWLAAILVFRWSAAVYTFLGLSIVSNIVVFRFQAGGPWQDDPVVMAIQYCPLLLLLLWEVRRGQFPSSGPRANTPQMRHMIERTEA